MAHLQQGAYEEADKAFLQALREDPEKGEKPSQIYMYLYYNSNKFDHPKLIFYSSQALPFK